MPCFVCFVSMCVCDLFKTVFKGNVSELLCDVAWCVCYVWFVLCSVLLNASVRSVCGSLCGVL